MSQPVWKQVGTIGDVNFPEYDGGPVEIDTTGVYEPEMEYVEIPSDDLDFGDPNARWTVYRVVLDPGVPDWGDIDEVASSSGTDPADLKAAFESDDPMDRANAYWDWAGHYGWHEFDSYPLILTCREVEKSYDVDLGCYREIQSEIETVVEEMADQNSASAWSTPGDQMVDDLEQEGFDQIVIEAQFGDAVAIDGDLLVGPHWADNLGVKANDLWDRDLSAKLSEWLEANGYEYLHRRGGRVPAEEGYAYDGDHVINAVAKRLNMPRETVEEAAKSLDWWQDEIPHGTSGHTYVWAKRKAAAGSTVSESRSFAAARTELAAHGFAIQRTGHGDFRVYRKGSRNPEEGYFTDDLDDAVQTGIRMAQTGVSEARRPRGRR